MECDDSTDNAGEKSIDESSAVVNSVILDYYKKFGRKRDLEQFFSLSTAETEVRDVSSLFWRRMKSQSDSDSGEKKSKSESPTELCRISIKCSLPEPSSSSQDDTVKTKSDSESPPIITEEAPSQHTDEESINDDNHSQKSIDAILDTSINKPLSPTSSVNSQRKLEWDSLADVGYANETDRKNSASSLSTLERLALKQQYSNNGSPENELGAPTAHSTLMEVVEKPKGKKGGMRKTTKIYKKEVDIVEVSLPQGSETSPSQPINVNLTKHISFNMDKDGGISLDSIKKDLNVTPDNVVNEPEVTPQVKSDKEIQTTLTKSKEKDVSPEINNQSTPHTCCPRVPVLINLNTLRKRYRRKKLMTARRKPRNKKKITVDKENTPVQEKSAEQVSAAESFEYMPGHVYNQNQMNFEQPAAGNMTGNKSSLESSAAVTTTESSKDSRHSFTKDLERSMELLKVALRKSNDDSELKNKLIKEVVQRLLKSRYRDDDSSTDFLSGLSFNSKKLGLSRSQVTTTTNTSDSNNTEVKTKMTRPKKSILRSDKFNPNILASTSQSAPNLPVVSNSEKPIIPNHKSKTHTTESDISSGGKNSSDAFYAKASSGELYQKYLEALNREEAYKRHLKDKEMFLKQKLVRSESPCTIPKPEATINNRLQDLIKDLTRNNYDDGSGDASKLEGGSNSNPDFQRYNIIKKPRSHSVFTLSSGNSDNPNRKANLKKKIQNEIKNSQIGSNKQDCKCCCVHQYTTPRIGLIDSSVQVNIKSKSNEGSIDKHRANATDDNHGNNTNSPRNIAHVTNDEPNDIKYVCLCNKPLLQKEMPDNMLIYKCSRLTSKDVPFRNTDSKTSDTVGVQCVCQCQPGSESFPLQTTSKDQDTNGDKNVKLDQYINSEDVPEVDKMSKTSQTNLDIKMIQRKSSVLSYTSSSSAGKRTRETSPKSVKSNSVDLKNKIIVHEATRAIQTEISFNPRIADPSLTDIKIINDEDCVELINERFRDISKRNSEMDLKCPKTNHNLNSDTGSEGSAKMLRSDSNNKEEVTYKEAARSEKVDKEIQSDAELNNNEVQVDMNHPKEHIDSDNFAIPIQGTNMTLMVRIGSKPVKNDNDEKRSDVFTTQCVGTDNAVVDEKGTCITEECSKGVQSQPMGIFSSIYTNEIISPRTAMAEKPTEPISTILLPEKEIMNMFNKNFVTATTEGSTVRNTYPRAVQVNPKHFLRSNTDTGRFVSSTMPTINSIEKIDALIQGSSNNNSLPSSNKSKTDSEDVKSKGSEKSCNTANDLTNKADSGKDEKESSSDVPHRKSSSESEKDPILDIIRDITKRYSKKDIDSSKKKKCFKEIITVLNHLLDTEDGTDSEPKKTSDSPRDNDMTKDSNKRNVQRNEQSKKVDKAVQMSPKKSKPAKQSTESSEIPATTDPPETSTDSTTCKVLGKIKRECDKYHQKRCKSHVGKKCDASSSTSVSCEQCRRVHHCPCRGHRCHKSKSSADKLKKKCIAYNLVIQSSDSMIEETLCDNAGKPLQNIVVKVPKRKQTDKVPFKEVSAKIEKNLPSNQGVKTHRSKSCPNDSEISSIDDAKTTCGYTVRDYLERNRPDFLEKTSSRQQCLKIISEKRNREACLQPNLKMFVLHSPECMRSLDPCNMYCRGLPMICSQFHINPCNYCVQSEVTGIANNRAVNRQLLSTQLDLQPSLTSLSESELHRLAKDLGFQLRNKKLAPKFISERDMKKHSEKIYKSLPEVVQKKENAKKENIKKTNLLMANIFKKNLQKKTLRGAVNISNYSAVIKI